MLDDISEWMKKDAAATVRLAAVVHARLRRRAKRLGEGAHFRAPRKISFKIAVHARSSFSFLSALNILDFTVPTGIFRILPTSA